MGTATKVTLGIVCGGLLLMGGCATLAIGGTAAVVNEVDKEMKADEKAAASDIVYSGCDSKGKDAIGLEKIVGSVVITNSSDKTRTYSVTVDVTDSKGVKAGTMLALADNVAPGAVYKDQIDTYAEDGAVGPFTCKVSDTTAY